MPAGAAALGDERSGALLLQLISLSAPVLAEHVLHMAVGLTDTWLANHLPEDQAAAAAAVGTITYVLWLIGLMVASIATGSTALIARARGARHRSLANSVCGQSATSAVLLGIGLAVIAYVGAQPLVHATGLHGRAQQFAFDYLRMLCISLPFSTFMFVANACLRGDGDTVTPAVAMIIVDVINMGFSFGLTYGWLGLPKWGFNGIAAGTVIAYVAGGLIQLGVLLLGRAGVRLHLHRLQPHWLTLKRIMRIGIPSGLEGMLAWAANFFVVIAINQIDATNTMPAAHNNAIRIESLSYLCGFAVAMAAATMVGQSLGMKNPRRATLSAYLAYAVGGSIMTFWGVIFILFGNVLANWLSADATIARLTTQCLFITGFIQVSFAASAVFSGALRGAGDTLAVMILNLSSIVCVRLVGVIIVTRYLHLGLAAIWMVLAGELFLRGALIYARFLQGGWKHVRV
jgi:putative MATE family efflux protein